MVSWRLGQDLPIVINSWNVLEETAWVIRLESLVSGADPHRFPPFYGNQLRVFMSNIFLIWKTSPSWNRGMKKSADLQGVIRGEWNWPISCLNDSETREISRWSMPLHPTRTLRLRCSFSGNRLIFILNRRLGLPQPVGILNLVGLNETFGLPEVLTL